MKRRTVLKLLATSPVLLLPARARTSQSATVDIEALRENWREYLAEGADISFSTAPIRRSKEEWRKTLTSAQYRVLREEDTERAFTSPLNEEKRPGVYVCAGCRLPLFTSAMKYNSGTGWPSFFTTIPGSFETKKDYFLIFPRTEYHCARCGGHHGHVFDDGPPPTGQRWCNNGVALEFIPKNAVA